MMEQVWREMVLNGLNEQEREIAYRWLQNILANQRLHNSAQADFLPLFNELICSKQSIGFLSSEGFSCLKTMFCLINVRAGRIRRLR